METNVNYTIVGLFVIILTSAMILAIIWLSSGLSVEHFDPYLVFMNESVSGLSPDAAVEFNGVNVGEVKKIEIDKTNPHLVKILLNVKQGTPITIDTIATLTTRGLTGIVFIALKDQGTDSTPLKPDPQTDEKVPVIKSGPSFFLRLDTGLKKLNDSISRVSTSIGSLLDESNTDSIRQTLLNIREITSALASDKLVSNLDVITRNISEITNDIRQNPAIMIRGKEPTQLGPGEK